MKYLIAGLGNVGEEYRDTRHNVGFMVADRLADALGVKPELKRHAFYAEGKHKGRKICIVMPTTYMNLSGKAIRYYLNECEIPPERLLVVTDDIALPFGALRMRKSGSDGGHNGLRDIQLKLNSSAYPRLRFGVGDDFSRGRQVDYVLSPFTDDEFAQLPAMLDDCVQGILDFATIGVDRAMSGFNKKG